MHEATRRLLDLGLSEKEAGVYLALLELGPSIVQQVAEKAGVNRSTCYALIESLKQRGLVSEVERDERVAYVPESPQRLVELVEKEAQELSSKRETLQQVMPDFLALFNALGQKPRVRYFEGEKGIISARRALMEADITKEYVSFTAIDEATNIASRIDMLERQRMAQRLHGRLIIAIQPGMQLPETDLRAWDVRCLPYDQAPFTGEVDIFGDKVAAFIFHPDIVGLLVDSAHLSRIFRALFEAAWKSAAPYIPKAT